LAFAGEPLTETSRADAPRPDGRPNYTVDAVLALKRTLDDHASLFCLMGVDSWLTIGKWYRAPELLMACDFIVGARPGFDLDQIPRALPDGIHAVNEQSDSLGRLLSQLTDSTGRRSHLYLLPDLAEDVSATEVRAALSDHMETHTDPNAVLSPGVANYIRARRLYGVET
jgi:nicotinate-nucleotide adenylyltransferase